jgi:hypothetical protein
MLEFIFHTLSHNYIRTNGLHDWRRVSIIIVVTFSLAMVGISSWLWFGLSSWNASFEERYTTLVGYWFKGLLMELFCFSRLRCSWVAFVPMFG